MVTIRHSYASQAGSQSEKYQYVSDRADPKTQKNEEVQRGQTGWTKTSVVQTSNIMEKDKYLDSCGVETWPAALWHKNKLLLELVVGERCSQSTTVWQMAAMRDGGRMGSGTLGGERERFWISCTRENGRTDRKQKHADMRSLASS